MKVKEIMTREVKSIPPDISVGRAMEVLLEGKISGLPVVDKEGKLVGMFTEKNILAHLLPQYLGYVGAFVYDQNPKATRKKLLELGNIAVNQLMTKEVITADGEMTLCEATRIMLMHEVRRLPVVDKTGTLAGIVAREDILKAFAAEAHGAA